MFLLTECKPKAITEHTHFMKPKPKKVAQRKKPARKAPGRRAENKERTKKAILKAALALFAKKGFQRTTTKEISKRAGIAEGTLFNYFRTKEDLALYFFEQEVAELIRWYECEADLQSAPAAEKLFAIITHYLERIAPYEDFIGAVYLRALQPNSKLSPLSLDRRDVNIHYLKFIKDILSEAEADGEIPPVGDLGAYAFGLFQLAVLTHWLHDDSTGKEDTMALLDRCLNMSTAFFQKGGWEW